MPSSSKHTPQTHHILSQTANLCLLAQDTLSFTWTIPHQPAPPDAHQVSYANSSEGESLIATKRQPLNNIRYAYHRWKLVHSTPMLHLRNELDNIRAGRIGKIVKDLVGREIARKSSVNPGARRYVQSLTSRIDLDALEGVVQDYLEVLRSMKMDLKTAVNNSRANPRRSREFLRGVDESFEGWMVDLKHCERDLGMVANGVWDEELESERVDSAVQLGEDAEGWAAWERGEGYGHVGIIDEYADDGNRSESGVVIEDPASNHGTRASAQSSFRRQTQVRFDEATEVREFEVQSATPSPMPEVLRIGSGVGPSMQHMSPDLVSEHGCAVGRELVAESSRHVGRKGVGWETRDAEIQARFAKHTISSAAKANVAAIPRVAINRTPRHRVSVPAISSGLEGSSLHRRRSNRKLSVVRE